MYPSCWQSLADMRNNSHRSLSEMEKKELSQPAMAAMGGNLSRQNSVSPVDTRPSLCASRLPPGLSLTVTVCCLYVLCAGF